MLQVWASNRALLELNGALGLLAFVCSHDTADGQSRENDEGTNWMELAEGMLKS